MDGNPPSKELLSEISLAESADAVKAIEFAIEVIKAVESAISLRGTAEPGSKNWKVHFRKLRVKNIQIGTLYAAFLGAASEVEAKAAADPPSIPDKVSAFVAATGSKLGRIVTDIDEYVLRNSPDAYGAAGKEEEDSPSPPHTRK